jgi:putative exporter of polyketide antibiotics
MPPRTTFLSRLIGIYAILISLSMLTHKQATIEMVTALVHSPPVLYLVGVMLVIAGLAMILGHNIWSGGALPVIVTLISWLTLTKGQFFLFVPPEAAPGFFLEGFRYEQLFYLYAAISLFLGSYLTYSGVRSR